MILVDTNVIIDVLANDPNWSEWSTAALLSAVEVAELAINPIIYAELAVAYRSASALEKALRPWPFVRLPLPYEAGFLAAQAFRLYRERGGAKQSPLPDFYIGAQAQTEGLELLTRDSARYRTYFPKVVLHSPRI